MLIDQGSKQLMWSGKDAKLNDAWTDATSLYNRRPAITFANPLSPGDLAVGQTVHFFGNGFLPGGTIRLASFVCDNINIISSTEAFADVPAGAQGQEDVGFLYAGSNGTSDFYGKYTVPFPPISLTAYQQLCVNDGAIGLFAFSRTDWSSNAPEVNLADQNNLNTWLTSGGGMSADFSLVLGDDAAVFDNFSYFYNGGWSNPADDVTLEFVAVFHSDPIQIGILNSDVGDLFDGPCGALVDNGDTTFRYRFTSLDASGLGTPGQYVQTGPLALETRYHICYTYDSLTGNMRLYLNGSLVDGPTAVINNFRFFFQLAVTLNASGITTFNELAYYPLVLNATQVLAHYNAALP